MEEPDIEALLGEVKRTFCPTIQDPQEACIPFINRLLIPKQRQRSLLTSRITKPAGRGVGWGWSVKVCVGLGCKIFPRILPMITPTGRLLRRGSGEGHPVEALGCWASLEA